MKLARLSVNPAWGLLAGGITTLSLAFPFGIYFGTLSPLVLERTTSDSALEFSDRYWANLLSGHSWLALAVGIGLGIVAGMWQRVAVLSDYAAVCEKTALTLIGKRSEAGKVKLRSNLKRTLVVAGLPVVFVLLNFSIITGLLGYAAGYNFTVFSTTRRLNRDADKIQEAMPLDESARPKSKRYRSALGVYILAIVAGSVLIAATSTFLTVTKLIPYTREAVAIHEEIKDL